MTPNQRKSPQLTSSWLVSVSWTVLPCCSGAAVTYTVSSSASRRPPRRSSVSGYSRGRDPRWLAWTMKNCWAGRTPRQPGWRTRWVSAGRQSNADWQCSTWRTATSVGVVCREENEPSLGIWTSVRIKQNVLGSASEFLVSDNFRFSLCWNGRIWRRGWGQLLLCSPSPWLWSTSTVHCGKRKILGTVWEQRAVLTLCPLGCTRHCRWDWAAQPSLLAPTLAAAQTDADAAGTERERVGLNERGTKMSIEAHQWLLIL